MNSESVNTNTRFEELVESYLNGTISEEHSKELLDMVRADEKLQVQFASQLQVSHLLETKELSDPSDVSKNVLSQVKTGKYGKWYKANSNVPWSSVVIRIAAILMVIFVVTYYVDFIGKDRVEVKQIEVVVKQDETKSSPVLKKTQEQEVSTRREKQLLDSSISSHKSDMDDLITDLGKVPAPQKARKPVVDEPSLQLPPQPADFDKVMQAKPSINVKNINGLKQNDGKEKSKSAATVSGDAKAGQDRYDYRKEDLPVIVGKREEMVPLEIEIPKPQFAGTPKDIRSANLESHAEHMERLGYSINKAAPESGALQSRLRRKPLVAGGQFMPPPEMPPRPVPSRESYAKIEENVFLDPHEKPLSTFSIDVDTASYSNLRRMLNNHQLPPPDAVRLEEMINYFDYSYEGPGDEKPFSTAMAMHVCPWNKDHYLLRVGLQGRKMDESERKPSNLVFLLDVSGSMNSYDKLPLLKKGMTMLVRALSENDRVAIVVYAGSTGLVLDSTSAGEKERIIDAMERLSAGGSTAGGAGIQLAYQVARDNFIKGGVNRVILATDGDFNVGVSSHDGLQQMIEEKRKSGVFLSVLGFGTGNLQDSKMELLANKGNGNYFYIDSEREAEKVLVKQLNATLVTIAKDVKIQVEFNPEHIKSYRLIGYENRKMAARDFDDDKKDAGEIGAGHQVTALYEIVPVGAPDQHQGIPLKYGRKDEKRPEPATSEMLTLKLRYKAPDGDVSKLLEFPYTTRDVRDGSGDDSFRWAASVAAFGQILRGSQYVGNFSLNDVRSMALEAKGEDSNGYRAEFINLIDRAASLKGQEPPTNDKGYPVWQYRN